MDVSGVAPTPITSVEELLAKMDLILGAAQQWVEDDNDELGAMIFRRMRELSSDFDIILSSGPGPDWEAVGEKLMAIKEALRQRSVRDLESMYERS